MIFDRHPSPIQRDNHQHDFGCPVVRSHRQLYQRAMVRVAHISARIRLLRSVLQPNVLLPQGQTPVIPLFPAVASQKQMGQKGNRQQIRGQVIRRDFAVVIEHQ